MIAIFKQMIHILLVFIIILQINSGCINPQKSIFLSLRSLAGRQHMQRMFNNMSLRVSNYSLSYTQAYSNKSYEIIDFRYRFRYNSYYQKQSYVDQKTVKVLLGRIDLLAQMNYNIKDSRGKTIYQGVQYASSSLDPSYFQKQLIEKDDYVQWQVFSTDLISFYSLWTMQGNFQLPNSEQYVLQKMLNYIVPTLQLNRIIFDEINILFKQNLRKFLNSDHLFTTNQIPYKFKNISLPLIHKVRKMSVSNISQSLIALIDFEVSDVEQTKCNKIPQSFQQKDYGGIQQVISSSTINFLILQAIKRGVFNLTLDRSWQSQVFQFYIGDLANAVNQANLQDAISPFLIKCQPANISRVISSQFDETHLYLQLPQQCLIQYKNESIIKLELYLITLVKIIAEREYLSFIIDKAYSRNTKYVSMNPKFVITNSDVALMIEDSLLNKMLGTPVFGSNLPLIEKKSPALILFPDYLVVFDTSQFLPNTKLTSDQIKSS